jgi:hypothetical protein
MSEAMDILTTHAAAASVREESYLRSLGEKAARDVLDALLRGDVDPERPKPHSAAPRRASPLLVVRERAIVAVVPADARERQIARLTAARTALKTDTGISLYCRLSSPCAGFLRVACRLRSGVTGYEPVRASGRRTTNMRELWLSPTM